MIILGIILVVIGVVAKISILTILGIIVVVAGVILMVLGAAGRQVGGRKHYW